MPTHPSFRGLRATPPLPTQLHRLALERMGAGQPREAARLLAEALGEGETAELWNDWATVQAGLGAPAELEEAAAGYRRALALAPADPQAAYNLGVLEVLRGRVLAGLDLLRAAAPRLGPEDRAHADALLAEHRDAAPDGAVAALDAGAPTDGPGLDYFRVHRDRYAATLDLLPRAAPGETLLELGASFHHLTPALEAKGYAVRCADLRDGEAPRAGETRRYPLDDFDLERDEWPYADGRFDVVVFCEILEHLAVDPMRVMAEINRVLKPGGRLLLTTPNVASAKSVASVLGGESPYVFGQFVPGGRAGDRHHREYTASEVEALLAAAGFEPLALETRNSWWKDRDAVLARLVAGGHRIGRRGDDVLALARKAGPVRERHPEELYCRAGCHAEQRPEVERTRPKRVLLLHEVLPHHDKSGSDVRFLQVVRRLRAAGHHVTYLARNGVDQEKYRPPLEALGVTVYAHDAAALAALGVDAAPDWTLEQVVEPGRFDVAILFHWFWAGLSMTEQYLDDLRRLSPATRIVVLTDDRHGLRELRGAELSGLSVDRERAADYTARELECYRAADLVAAITEDDRQGLRELAPELEIELLPMTAKVGPSGPGFEARHGFVFLGNFDNLANRDALTWFLGEVWPRIRKRLPGAALHVAGNAVPAEYGKHPGVVLLGHVPDVAATLAAHRVFVSPIRFGTGIKTKNLAALGNGIPMVTTTVGAEGMSLVPGVHALVADAAAAFATAAADLHEDRARWEALAESGRRHLEATFSVARLDAQLGRILERACALAPRPFDPAHRFSIRLAEEEDPGVLAATPPHLRLERRIRACVRLAERAAEEGRFAEALGQLRHTFHAVRGGVPSNLLFARVFALSERCYRALGDAAAAARCAGDTRRCLPAPAPALARPPRRRRDDPALSVIVPTYRRPATLARCLDALAAQRLSPDRFEVVVVDDGSGDDTAAVLRARPSPFRLVTVEQPNQGAGAARRLGVEHARGTWLLLANDDSILDPACLAEHLRLQEAYPEACLAALGTFEYERAALRRALTHFLSVTGFLFPQAEMAPDRYHGPSQFVTCNLSVRRDAVVAAGSFDPALRVAEDTDLGLRLASLGVKVVHLPGARAIHDHLDLSVPDLVRRGRAYGPAWLRLLEKHPSLVLSQLGVELRGRLGAADVARVREALAPLRAQTEEIVEVLTRQDAQDFTALLAKGKGPGSPAVKVIQAFARTLPQVHWFHVLDALCEAWEARPPGGVPRARGRAESQRQEA